MTTELATATHCNLDLFDMTLGQQTRLVTDEGHYWLIRCHEKHSPDGDTLAGFYVQSDDPTWIQRQGEGSYPINRIGRYIAEGRTYFLGGFELHIAEVHSVHRRQI